MIMIMGNNDNNDNDIINDLKNDDGDSKIYMIDFYVKLEQYKEKTYESTAMHVL